MVLYNKTMPAKKSPGKNRGRKPNSLTVRWLLLN